MTQPGWGRITDVPGVQVGHAQRIGDGWLSGVTVVLPPAGTVGAVDVRGGGPGTHETDALDPTTLVPTVDAVTLTGGSSYGLVCAHGVQRWCERQGRGLAVGRPDPGSLVVPIVPAAALFDLGRGGDPAARPDAELGHSAAVAAVTDDGAPLSGCVGAGTGAVLAGQRLKGGIGTAGVQLDGGVVVGALVALNAAGSCIDEVTGALLGTAFVPPGLARPRPPARPVPLPEAGHGAAPTSTSLAVVATNAALDPARARRTATGAHDGLARAVSPAHTLVDGDTVFCLATGQLELEPQQLLALQAAAADAVLLAMMDAALSATATRTPAIDVPGYLDLYPDAAPR